MSSNDSAPNFDDTNDPEGIGSLSVANQIFLVSTIIVFLSLSVVSGQKILRTYGSFRNYHRTRSQSFSTTTTTTSTTTNDPNTNSRGGGGSSSYNIAPKHGSIGMLSHHSMPSTTDPSTSSSTTILEDESMASASPGAEMKNRFNLLLFMASSLRVCALVLEVCLVGDVTSTTSLWSRLITAFIWVPAVLFLSMYGLVLLFWAQLCYACWGIAYPWPRWAFFIVNVLLYAFFVVLFFVAHTSSGLWRALDVLLGSIYLVGLFGIIYYGLRLIYFFRKESAEDDFFFELPPHSQSSHAGRLWNAPLSRRQRLIRRITAVCVLLCMLFAGKAVYLLGMGTGFIPSEEAHYRSPLGIHHIAFEFGFYFITEFIPCALMLYFTTKNNEEADAGSHSTTNTNTNNNNNNSNNTKPGTPNLSLRGQRPATDDTLTGYQYQAMHRSYPSRGPTNNNNNSTSTGDP